MENSKKPEEKLVFDKNALSRIMENVTESEGTGKAKAQRRGCTVVIYPQLCIPNSIAEPVKLGFEELDSDGELVAYQNTGGISISEDESEEKAKLNISQQALMVCFAREALCSINGMRLTSDQKYVIWNMLDQNGRIVCGNAYMAGCTGGKDGAVFMKKSLASLEIY